MSSSLIGKKIGNYEIKAKLGEGGMGAVYLGEHPMIGKKVAIKVLLEELVAKEDIVQRFFNEAKAVNDIGHPNIIDVVDFGKIKGDHGGDVVYFIMEFLEGDSLSGRLRTTGLSQAETMHVIRQCCSGLMASHKKGIIHRDLKPENIYLVQRGADRNFIKILDFGIAKLTGTDGATSSKTRTGLVIGTPTYMSPEQCDGRGLIDSRADIYSLGVVMFELLTGRVPFPGDGFGEVLVAHLTKPPPRPSELNPDIRPEIEAIVMHAIEKDKNRRFQTMEEFEAAINDPATHAANYLGGNPDLYGGAGGGAQTIMMGGPPPLVAPRTVVGMQSPTRPTTTLSGSSGQVGGAPSSGSRVGLFAMLFLVLAGAGGGGAYWFLRNRQAGTQVVSGPPSSTSTAATPATTAAAAPVAPVDDSVIVTVASEPKGAKVLRSDTGEVAGTTPIDIKLKKGGEPIDVRLTLEGYQTVKRTINADRNKEITVAMAPDAPAPTTPEPLGTKPASPSTKPASPSSKPSSSSSAKPSSSPSSRPSKPTTKSEPSSKPAKPGKKPADPDAPMDINF